MNPWMSASGRADATTGGLLLSDAGAPCSCLPNKRPSTPPAVFVTVFVLLSWLKALLRQSVLGRRGRLRLTVGDQRVNILNAQARIRFIKPDGSAVRASCKVHELLEMFPYRRRWSALGELEQQVKHLSDVLGEIRDIRVERAVINSEETYLVVL